MNPLKFRAWDIAEQEMIYGMNKCLMNWDGLQHNVDRFFDGDIPVMQYTGLKDNDSKELYFDDIVNKYYGDKFSSTEVITNLNDLARLCSEKDESGMNFEVMGNIYENPELLERR